METSSDEERETILLRNSFRMNKTNRRIMPYVNQTPKHGNNQSVALKIINREVCFSSTADNIKCCCLANDRPVYQLFSFQTNYSICTNS